MVVVCGVGVGGIWPFGVFQQDYAFKSDVFAVPLFIKKKKKKKIEA